LTMGVRSGRRIYDRKLAGIFKGPGRDRASGRRQTCPAPRRHRASQAGRVPLDDARGIRPVPPWSPASGTVDARKSQRSARRVRARRGPRPRICSRMGGPGELLLHPLSASLDRTLGRCGRRGALLRSGPSRWPGSPAWGTSAVQLPARRLGLDGARADAERAVVLDPGSAVARRRRGARPANRFRSDPRAGFRTSKLR